MQATEMWLAETGRGTARGIPGGERTGGGARSGKAASPVSAEGGITVGSGMPPAVEEGGACSALLRIAMALSGGATKKHKNPSVGDDQHWRGGIKGGGGTWPPPLRPWPEKNHQLEGQPRGGGRDGVSREQEEETMRREKCMFTLSQPA